VAQTSDETRATLQSQLDASAFEEAWEQGQALTMDQAISLALESARAV
jgi:hypothetical protein